MQRYTFNDFNREFPTDESCLQWLVDNRWPDGITCSKCERITKELSRNNSTFTTCSAILNG